MRTRAKFYLSGLTLLPGKDAGVQVSLTAVARGDRNASWARATPSGSLQMTINNPAAAEVWDQFMRAARETGRQPEVFIDIWPSEDGWPGDGHKFRLFDTNDDPHKYGEGKCGECGFGQDDETFDYDTVTHKKVQESVRPVHPNG